jgi:signal transduction histidine kinase
LGSDIDEPERTRALEEALGRMQAILASIGDGVLMEDLDQNLIPLNATAEAMLQEMADNFLLGPLRELVTAPSDDTAPQEHPWLLESRHFEVGRKVLSAHSAAVRTEDGKHLGTVIVLRDVTAEVEAEQLKDAFMAHISHELRTPLTAVKGYSELLLVDAVGPLTDEQRDFLTAIHRHTSTLVDMINTLLDFSEMEAWDNLNLQRYPTRPSTLVEEAIESWYLEMREKGLQFEVELSPDLPLIYVDRKRMRWVIVNLVRNAWQYTPEGGRVSVRLYAEDDKVVLEVADTGIGISRRNQERLFSRFYRVANTVRSRGIGLGLYVSQAIVEEHEGEIVVTSEEGVGSTFSVKLPAMPDELQRAMQKFL